MSSPANSSGARIASWGARAAVVVALVAALAQVLYYVLHVRGKWLLNMNTHASVFGAVSLLALAAACGAAALLSAADAHSRLVRLLPAVLAALLGLRVIHPANVILLALPLVVAAFVALWWRVGAPGSDAQRAVRAGCVVLVGSYLLHAFGASLLSAFGYGEHTRLVHAELLLRHTGELAGWMLVATGLAAAHACRRGGRLSPPISMG